MLFTFLNKTHLTTLTEITLNSRGIALQNTHKMHPYLLHIQDYLIYLTYSLKITMAKKKKKINKFNHEFLSRIQKQQQKSSSETGRNTVKAA